MSSMAIYTNHFLLLFLIFFCIFCRILFCCFFFFNCGIGMVCRTFPGNDSSTNNPTFVSASNGSNRNKRKTGSRSDGRFERKWVDDITKGSGIGIKINASDLTKYVQQFENLSQDHVLEYLDEKLLGADSWKEQGKALTLLEGLLDGQSSSTVEEYFQQSYESLQSLAEEGKPILKKKD